MEKDLEKIRIDIDPDTLKYKIDLSFCDVEDVYIVLRDIVFRFETGDLADLLEVKDEHGKQLEREAFEDRIRELKQELDSRFGVAKNTTNDFRGGHLN